LGKSKKPEKSGKLFGEKQVLKNVENDLKQMKVVIIGAGNLATHLSLAIQNTSANIIQLYSRSEDNGTALAKRLGVGWTTQLSEITSEADLYLFAVKDDAIPEIIPQIPANKGLWVHTAGSVPMDIFKGYTEHYGVLYPFQTFTKNREVDLQNVPFFIETRLPEDERLLVDFACKLSNNVQTLSSEKRKYVHLAAVFACNFSNHLYALAYKILEEQNIPHGVLLPLIDETVAKIHALSPQEAQTGPAVRNDLHVMNRQLELLTDPAIKEIYKIISNGIYDQYQLRFNKD
jgi:predicted short-subunit dehydrogenase-like oxidoreductase (DUF2520 family)